MGKNGVNGEIDSLEFTIKNHNYLENDDFILITAPTEVKFNSNSTCLNVFNILYIQTCILLTTSQMKV